MIKPFGLCSVLLAAVILVMPCTLFSAVNDDMEYLGYSKDLTSFAQENIKKTHVNPSSGKAALGMQSETPTDESDAVQEQLTELGRSRSLTPQTDLTTGQVKEKIDGYWSRMGFRTERNAVFLSEEQKNSLKERLRAGLEGSGFLVKQLDLLDTPPDIGIPQVRGVVRVVRPLKSRNAYQEMQNNLSEVKDICIRAATIEGTLYLRELTTFMAENPRNNYFYEKTIIY